MVYGTQKGGRGEVVCFAIGLQQYSNSVGIVGGRGQYKNARLVHKSFDVNAYLVKAQPVNRLFISKPWQHRMHARMRVCVCVFMYIYLLTYPPRQLAFTR